jgi:hypothetical protein
MHNKSSLFTYGTKKIPNNSDNYHDLIRPNTVKNFLKDFCPNQYNEHWIMVDYTGCPNILPRAFIAIPQSEMTHANRIFDGTHNITNTREACEFIKQCPTIMLSGFFAHQRSSNASDTKNLAEARNRIQNQMKNDFLLWCKANQMECVENFVALIKINRLKYEPMKIGRIANSNSTQKFEKIPNNREHCYLLLDSRASIEMMEEFCPQISSTQWIPLDYKNCTQNFPISTFKILSNTIRKDLNITDGTYYIENSPQTCNKFIQCHKQLSLDFVKEPICTMLLMKAIHN